MSSRSSPPSTTTTITLPRNHICQAQGCGKRFTRAEHLRRHALNHELYDNSCERCSVHFSRPDLLARHMMRHAKKDEEAGGFGLGVLDTRKRTRRLPNGSIVTRPTKRQNRSATTTVNCGVSARDVKRNNDNNNNSRSSNNVGGLRNNTITTTTTTAAAASMNTSSPAYGSPDYGGQSSEANNNERVSSSLSDCSISLDHHDIPTDGAPISPPRSTNASGLSCSLSLQNETLDATTTGIDSTSEQLLAPMMPNGPYEPFVEPIPGQFDIADGAWQTDAMVPTSFDMDKEDTFYFDTATSFNMPFATSHNYNWLFDASSLNDAFNTDEALFSAGLSNFVEPVPDMWSQPHHRSTEPSSQMRSDPVGFMDGLMSFQTDNQFGTFGLSAPVPQTDCAQNPGQQVSSSDLDCMGPVLPAETPNPLLPRITEEDRAEMLGIIAQARPTMMDGTKIDHTSPLLSLNSFQNYCDLFFARFNQSYPIIHQATFDPSKVEKLLLVAVISLGATYSSRDAHRLAVAIHDILRNLVFAHADFSANPDLWVLQAMVLIDCFGKSRAGHKQRDMAQLFHCVLIKLIRRSDCTTIRTPPVKSDRTPDTTTTGGDNKSTSNFGFDSSNFDLDVEWRRAMDAEQRKRLAILCFMWDTQHAMLFSQSLCMSAFEIRSSLPCDQGTWEASSAEEWYRNLQHENSNEPKNGQSQSPSRPRQHLPFLNVLKAYITPNAVQRPRHLNALSRILLLHGLMSITSDLKRRDQTTLRIESPDLVGAWKTRISHSFDLWKADFDADCMNMKLSLMSDLRAFTGHKTAAYALYHTAHITLNVEVLDLQIFAGATHILGRGVTDADVQRSRRVVTKWANEDPRSAAKVARHASLTLRDSVMNLNDWDDSDAFHYPWCLYLATLSCWAFHLPASLSGSSKCSRRKPMPITDVEAKNQMTALLVGMTTCNSLEELSSVAGKFATNGLTAIMAKQLATVRWAIVHDAMKVLVNLSW